MYNRQYRPRLNLKRDPHSSPHGMPNDFSRPRLPIPRPNMGQRWYSPAPPESFNKRSPNPQGFQFDRESNRTYTSGNSSPLNPQNTHLSRSITPSLDNFNNNSFVNKRESLPPHLNQKFPTEPKRSDISSDEWVKRDSIPFINENNSDYKFCDNFDTSASASSMLAPNDVSARFSPSFQQSTRCKEEGSLEKLIGLPSERRPDSPMSGSALEQALEMLGTKDAVVGLDYIIEYKRNVSVAGSFPFRCNLCNSAISRPSIVDHIMGRKHRLRYLKAKNEANFRQIMTPKAGEFVKDDEIAKAASDLEKVYGRGRVTVDLGSENKGRDFDNFTEGQLDYNTDTVLSFDDIPIVSESLLPEHDSATFSKSSTKDLKTFSSKSLEKVPKSEQSSNFLKKDDVFIGVAKQEAQMCLSPTSTSSIFSTDCSKFKNLFPIISENTTTMSTIYSSLSNISLPGFFNKEFTIENPSKLDLKDDKNQSCSYQGFSDTSQASLNDSKENIVYSNYANHPIPYVSGENEMKQYYQNSIQNTETSASISYPIMSQSSMMLENVSDNSKPHVTAAQIGTKRPASPFLSLDNRLQKIMKTEIKSENFKAETNRRDFFLSHNSSCISNNEAVVKSSPLGITTVAGWETKENVPVKTILASGLKVEEKSTIGIVSNSVLKEQENLPITTVMPNPELKLEVQLPLNSDLNIHENSGMEIISDSSLNAQKSSYVTTLSRFEDFSDSFSKSEVMSPLKEISDSGLTEDEVSRVKAIFNSDLKLKISPMGDILDSVVKLESATNVVSHSSLRTEESSSIEYNSDSCSKHDESIENKGIKSSTFELLSKCVISTDEEANIALQAVSVLMELFIKYKLQHIPSNVVESLIKSLHDGQVQGVNALLRHLDTDQEFKSVIHTTDKPVERSVPSRDTSENNPPETQFLKNSIVKTEDGKLPDISDSFQQEMAPVKVELFHENQKKNSVENGTNHGQNNANDAISLSAKCIVPDILKTETLMQECNANNPLIETPPMIKDVNTELKKDTINCIAAFSANSVSNNSISASVPTTASQVMLQQPTSSASLMPPPFFIQPVMNCWPNNHMMQQQVNYSAPYENNAGVNWNMPYHGSPYAGMSFFPSQQAAMPGAQQHFVGAIQQQYGIPQQYGNQQMFQNITQPPIPTHASPQPPLPSVPQPPLPVAPQPPLPAMPQPPLPKLSAPQPPLPPPLPPLPSFPQCPPLPGNGM